MWNFKFAVSFLVMRRNQKKKKKNNTLLINEMSTRSEQYGVQ